MNSIHEVKFKTNARTVNLLGRDNVLDFKSAIIELVKNSYDAFSDYSKIVIEDDKIVIADSGIGMSLQTIIDVFFTLGTDSKLNNSVMIGENNSKRVMNGSMGIGRLSLGRLGSKSVILTSDGKNVYRFEINWNEFLEGIDLVDLKFSIEEISFLDFQEEYNKIGINISNGSSGTIIITTELNDEWNNSNNDDPNSNYNVLVKSLQRLQSPTKNIDNFSVYLKYFNLTDEKIYTEVDDLNFDAELNFEYSSDGRIKISGTFEEIDIKKMPYGFIQMYKSDLQPFLGKDSSGQDIFVFSKYIDLSNKVKGEFSNQKVGDFQGRLYFIKKSRAGSAPFVKIIGDRISRDYIEKGISLYRDGFKIRPYGEENSVSFDWIGIESRRSSNPAGVTRKGYLMQANQLSGFVNITREFNRGFHDQANREGLKNSTEFMTLKQILLIVISEFSKIRSDIHIWYKEYLSSTSDKEYHSEKGVSKKRKIDSLLNKYDGDMKALYNDTEFNKLISRETIFELYSLTDTTEDKNRDLIDETDMLRALATQGITMSTFAHHIKNDKVYFKRSPDKLVKAANFFENEFSFDMKQYPRYDLHDFANTSKIKNSSIVSFINSALKNPKRNKKDKINVHDYFFSTFKWWRESVKDNYNDYKYTINNQVLDNTESIPFISNMYVDSNWQQLDNIFSNLIVNSQANFMENEINKRHINIDVSTLDRYIVFDYKDSGTGLSPEIGTDKDDIFEPFVSYSKLSGSSGMGMWILKSTINSLSGSVTVISEIGERNFEMKVMIPGGFYE